MPPLFCEKSNLVRHAGGGFAGVRISGICAACAGINQIFAGSSVRALDGTSSGTEHF